jgi:hypothetical protein
MQRQPGDLGKTLPGYLVEDKSSPYYPSYPKIASAMPASLWSRLRANKSRFQRRLDGIKKSNNVY